MQTTSDEVLISRIAAGDRLAMQVLYARHHVRVYRFVLRLVRNEATAEDLISEVFLDIWRQAGKFEGRSAASTWMLSIARFKALSTLRRRPLGAAGCKTNLLTHGGGGSCFPLPTLTRLWRRKKRGRSCGNA